MPRRLVSDLMSGTVYALPGSANVLEAARLMSDCHIGAILIVEEDRLIQVPARRVYQPVTSPRS